MVRYVMTLNAVFVAGLFFAKNEKNLPVQYRSVSEGIQFISSLYVSFVGDLRWSF
ncbi:hypothetical protein HMPREF0185_03503 [Brevundimonas diminuta 470-4]|nr:hypothetical protein HMPREF0185_03503 [Brevundimonas diminuta 470-4]